MLCCQLRTGDGLWLLRSLLHSVRAPSWEPGMGITELSVWLQSVQLSGVCYLVGSCGSWKN